MALEVRTEYLPAMKGMARLLLRERREDDRLCALLEDITVRATDPAWRSWAQMQLAAAR